MQLVSRSDALQQRQLLCCAERTRLHLHRTRTWVIINADKVAVTGNKEEDKLYRHYTGFVRGLRSYSFAKLIEKKPTEPLKITINGMLPNGRLGRALMGNLKVYAGAEHPHTAQNPQPLEV